MNSVRFFFNYSPADRPSAADEKNSISIVPATFCMLTSVTVKIPVHLVIFISHSRASSALKRRGEEKAHHLSINTKPPIETQNLCMIFVNHAKSPHVLFNFSLSIDKMLVTGHNAKVFGGKCQSNTSLKSNKFIQSHNMHIREVHYEYYDGIQQKSSCMSNVFDSLHDLIDLCAQVLTKVHINYLWEKGRQRIT